MAKTPSGMQVRGQRAQPFRRVKTRRSARREDRAASDRYRAAWRGNRRPGAVSSKPAAEAASAKKSPSISRHRASPSELRAERNQPALMPADHRRQRVHHQQRAHFRMFQRRHRGVAEPQSAHHHIPVPLPPVHPTQDAKAPPPLRETDSTSKTRRPASLRGFRGRLTNAGRAGAGSSPRAASAGNRVPRNRGSPHFHSGDQFLEMQVHLFVHVRQILIRRRGHLAQELVKRSVIAPEPLRIALVQRGQRHEHIFTGFFRRARRR